VQSGERGRQARVVMRCEEGAKCDMRYAMRKCRSAHVSRPAKTILQVVCVRVFADTVGLGGDERGDERRWKVPGGGWRFEMVISLAQGAVSEKRRR
jgi:hypothetical protein